VSGPRDSGTGTPGPDGDLVRAAFRHGGRSGADPAAVDAEAFLGRVHRGTRRRRARRTAGAVAAAATAAAVVVVGASVLPPSSEPDVEAGRSETESPDRAGAPESVGEPDPAAPASAGGSLEVYDVEATGDGVWALASRDCGRARLCPLVGRSTDEGQSWRLGYPETADGDRALAEVRHLDASDTGEEAVAAGSGLAVSQNAGQTWTPVEGDADQEVAGLAVGDDQAVAVLYGAGPGTLVTPPDTGWARGEPWTPSGAPVSGDEQLTQPFAVGDTVGAVVVAGRSARAEGVVARVAGGPWSRLEAPCETSTPLVTKADGTLWYLCYAASGSTLGTSSDVTAGVEDATWTTTALPGAGNAGLGPDGEGGVRVALDDRVFAVDASGRDTDVSGSLDGVDLTGDDYTYRSISGEWMASFRGALVHTPDDGRTWERVPVR